MMHDISARVWRLFISRRFAVTLLIVIAILLCLGILLPTLSYHEASEMAKFQREHPILFALGTTFNPPALASSWTFIFLNALLLLSTLFCTIERLKNHGWRHPDQRPPHFFKHKHEITAPDMGLDKAAGIAIGRLPAWKWRSRIRQSKQSFEIEAVQAGAAWGFWGSIIFHLGFLVIIAGIIISAYTRFSGTLLITEGQSIKLAKANWVQIDREPGGVWPFGGIEVTLNELKTEIAGGRYPTDYTSKLTVTQYGLGRADGIAKVNQAFKYDGLVFLLENYGFAPRFTVAKGKRSFVDAYFNLRGRTAGSRDGFSVPGSDIDITTVFYPDYGSPANIEPRNPAFEVNLLKSGRSLGKRLIRPGREARLGEYNVGLGDLKHWAYYRVSKDLGLPVIFWGFIAGAAGLIVRFVFYDRELRVTIAKKKDGVAVFIEGQSKFFPALFGQEIAALSGAIEREIKAGPKERAAV